MAAQKHASTEARPLGLRHEVALTGEELRDLRILEEFDLWFIEERLAEKDLLPQSLIPTAVEEFRRYVGLIRLGYKGFGVPSPEVDEVWHALILFTRDYARFCEAIGCGFIHHVPGTSRTPQEADDRELFADVYARYFGQPAGLVAERLAGLDCNNCRACAVARAPGAVLAASDCKHACKSCGPGCKACGTTA